MVGAAEARYVGVGRGLDDVTPSSQNTLESVRERFRGGARLKFLFFWGHEAARDQVGKEACSASLSWTYAQLSSGDTLANHER